MGVYLGSDGYIELRRSSMNVPLTSVLDAADVNTARRRFSFDFDPSALITGDQVEIRTENGSELELVAGHAGPDWLGFVHIDDVGGVRLYRSFSDAINGEQSKALQLDVPTTSKPIAVRTQSRDFQALARISQYQFTTSREAVDLTSLGDQHRHQYASGLISGQGSLSCLWEFERQLCNGDCPPTAELPHYFAQLVLRTQLGSNFEGRFYIYISPTESVWWECPICIVTNVAFSFEPSQPTRTSIEFVTSGPLSLKMGRPPAFLLQENSSYLLQESGQRLLLEDD
jgi:hypothetical protein